MTPRELPVLIERYRSELSAAAEPDPYLTSIGRRLSTHRFLCNCAQGVYRRQVSFLGKLLQAYIGRPPPQIRVLDWGCGKGHITYLLRKLGFAVVSCDVDDGSFDSAFGQIAPVVQEQAIEVVPLSDPVRLPFADASFDCVTSFGVLEHVPAEQESLHEIRRILTPGGIFFVSFLPYRLSWTQAFARLRGDSYHDRLYSRRHVLRIAERARFSVESIWHAQLFPKNAVPIELDRHLEPIDRALCRLTPLRYFATNLEVVLRAV